LFSGTTNKPIVLLC